MIEVEVAEEDIPADPILPPSAQNSHEGGDSAEDLETMLNSRLFDQPWYLSQYPDVADVRMDPLLHFYRHGCQEGRKPNPWFDPVFYRSLYADVREAGLDPFLHYIRFGDREGRRPHPHFDPIWFRSAYGLSYDEPALAYFLDHHLRDGIAPERPLLAVPYLPVYRRDSMLRIDPFLHYLDAVREAGKTPDPDYEVVEHCGLLDPNFYLINGSDVHEAKVDPIKHFCDFGWREQRNPNVYFNTKWYLTTNPDVAMREMNPLVHYALVGEIRGRRPVVYFDPDWYRKAYKLAPETSPLRHFLEFRRTQKFSPNAEFDVQWYMERNSQSLGGNRDPFAHFLQNGTYEDLDPSPNFESSSYRLRHIGRPSRHFRHRMHPDTDNPLIHYMHSTYK